MENIVIDKKELPVTEKSWLEFKKGFWVLFVVHLIFTGIFNNSANLKSVRFLQILPIVGMVIHIGKYSYAFSKNKKQSILKSLLGFMWVGWIGIFLAYYAVENDYYKSTGKIFTKRSKIFRLILIIICSLTILSVLVSITGAYLHK